MNLISDYVATNEEIEKAINTLNKYIFLFIRLLALLVKKLQIFVKKILIEKYILINYVFYLKI
ncbi:hypothetical protein [Spiroplasma poulsonii]|uniref:hypothetical protein n=1 Tax=Spiroplasma poulsonii TaxID=2138 RepID=UPI001331B9DA|nr:hypothetical protein [Spiroplasma poulsonii]KAF0851871.1 FtsX-like permease family [Spiroplasma poulsonii]